MKIEDTFSEENKSTLKIKRRLRYFDKSAFANELRNYLSETPSGSKEYICRSPWIVYVLFEWLCEVDSIPPQGIAERKDILWFIKRMWELHDNAQRTTDSLTLFLRPIISNQFWLQHDKGYWIRAFFTQYEIFHINETKKFHDEFKQETGIALFDFFLITLFIILSHERNKGKVTYFELIKNLHPHFTLETIFNTLKLYSGTLPMLKKFFTVEMPRKTLPSIMSIDARLLHRPLFLDSESLVSIDIQMAKRGLAEAALNHFIRLNRDGFRRRFGTAFQEFVHQCLTRKDIEFITDSNIFEIFEENNVSAKDTDFLITSDEGVIFVEAKAVVPRPDSFTTSNPIIVKQPLKNSILKGFEQIFECAFTLKTKCGYKLPATKNIFGLIVTQGEFFLKRGVDFSQYIEPTRFKYLSNKFGHPLLFENIFVISVNDFEYLLSSTASKPSYLVEFLKHCTSEDSDANTSKHSMIQHIESFLAILSKENKTNSKRLNSRKVNMKKLFNDLNEITTSNNEYWINANLGELLNSVGHFKNKINQNK
jgi:hypothetical protein